MSYCRPVSRAHALMSAHAHAGRPPTVHRGGGSRSRVRHLSTVCRSTPSRSAISMMPTGMTLGVTLIGSRSMPCRFMARRIDEAPTPSIDPAAAMVRPSRASRSCSALMADVGVSAPSIGIRCRLKALATVFGLTPSVLAIVLNPPCSACRRTMACRSARTAAALVCPPLIPRSTSTLAGKDDSLDFGKSPGVAIKGFIADGDHFEVSGGSGFVGQGLDLLSRCHVMIIRTEPDRCQEIKDSKLLSEVTPV